MPGTNLTRNEAQERAALLDVHHYAVDLDLTLSDTEFSSTTVVRFSSREADGATFADLVGATVHEITLNGRSLDPAVAYADSRIQLDDLAAYLLARPICSTHIYGGACRFIPAGAEDCLAAYRIVYGG